MKLNLVTFTIAVLVLAIADKELLHAAESPTPQPVTPTAASTASISSTSQASSTSKAPPTTLKPKIALRESELCKKCSCNFDYLQIDCTNKSMTTLFSDNDWNTLQNGDVFFETIKLDNNNISYVPQIPKYPVKSLYLSNNQIVNISLGAFQNLVQLENLDLSYNLLTSKALGPNVFKGIYDTANYQPMPNLKSLNLANNDMHTLHSDLFEHLANLETLTLSSNTFQVIDTSSTIAIASLSSLKTLDLSHNELKDLPETLFNGPKELETLILSGNLFQTLPAALTLAKSLRKLVLDINPLTDLQDNNVFKSLGELEYLSISYLPDITKIGPWAFSDLQSLQVLVAADNPRLGEIHELAFKRNTTNSDLFDYPPLKKLYLRNNNLTTIERNWIIRWDKMEEIDLNLNPWACDCTNSWMIHSLMKRINTTTPDLTKDVTCATPSAWKNRQLLQLADNSKELICENSGHPEGDSLILVGILVGVLIGVPLTLGGLVIFKRGCFGLVHRRTTVDRALYNRANFGDDFHI